MYVVLKETESCHNVIDTNYFAKMIRELAMVSLIAESDTAIYIMRASITKQLDPPWLSL